MTDAVKSKAKRRRPNWFLWWQVDPYELKHQVEDYDRLPLNKSARGISMMLMVGSSLLGLVIYVIFLRQYGGLIDVAIGVGLGLCMLGRNRWSKIAGMAYWTLEKLVGLVAGVFGTLHGAASVGQLIWWAVFMRFFYLAYQVERERRRSTALVAEVFS